MSGFILQLEVSFPLRMGSGSGDPVARREVLLPFAPIPGLTLLLGEEEVSLTLGDARHGEQLTWDGGSFTYYKSDFALRENADNEIRQEHLLSYAEAGWEIEWGDVPAPVQPDTTESTP